MQNRVKKQLAANEVDSVKDSPYRQGTWTVTKLKEELRTRHLPISGTKSELIDRLENSPVKTSVAPNSSARKSSGSPTKGSSSPLKGLVETMQAKLLEKKAESPLKKTVAATAAPGSPSLRGRSRSASPAGMMTRSRSTSLSRGTFLTWSRAPLSVLGNFVMAQIETVKGNTMFFGALAVFFAALSAILTLNATYRALFLEQFARVQPVLQVFAEGLLSNLGLTSSDFSQYVSKASRFMFDCASGNIERNSATGRLRCSASALKPFAGGLAGRLVWLTREQFVAWTAGSLAASAAVFFVTRKCRTALPLTNKSLRKALNLSTRFAFLIAAVCPFEAVGLIAGLAGFEGRKFAALLATKAFLAVPLQFSARILAAKHQKFINAQLERLPAVLMKAAAFLTQSAYVFKARQVVNGVLYALLCAAAVQVIANTRVYKNLRIKRN